MKKEIKPVHFLWQWGGCGKPHFLRISLRISSICHLVTELLLRSQSVSLNPRVLLLAPIGVTTNVNATTIHSGLGINCRGQFYPLNNKQKEFLSKRLSEVRFIIVDEISILSRKLLVQSNQRLIEILGSTNHLPFTGLPVIFCGDLHQLPPVSLPSIYIRLDDITISPWRTAMVYIFGV